MKKYKNWSVTRILLITLWCLFVLTFNAVAQTQSKIVEIYEKQFYNKLGEPIEVYDVRQGGKPINLASEFEGGEGWLKTLSFKVKNTSAKSITFIGNDFFFPETASAGQLMRFTRSYGQISGVTDKLDRKPIQIKPGESIEVSFSEKSYNELKVFLGQKHSIENINKVSLSIGFIIFDDNTAWSPGQYYKRDPDNPKKWIPLPINEK